MYSPTDIAAPGMPDSENSTAYTQSAEVTVGAFQNSNETDPTPPAPVVLDALHELIGIGRAHGLGRDQLIQLIREQT